MRVRALDAMPRLFVDGPWRMQMRLRRLEPTAWLLVSEHFEAELAEKRRLLDEGADVVARDPTEPALAAAAICETQGLIDAFLARHHPDLPPRPCSDDPLVRAGLSVQEDLCWLAPGPDGYRLISAFVAFPSRWRLSDKIGRPLPLIHAPVPGLEEHIGGALARVFTTLSPDRPVWRANWALIDDPALHQPSSSDGQPGRGIFMRVERQTLRRLPTTGVVLFTIHTFVEPLARVITDAASARGLLDQLDGMPAATRRYKNIDALRPAVEACLADVLEAA